MNGFREKALRTYEQTYERTDATPKVSNDFVERPIKVGKTSFLSLFKRIKRDESGLKMCQTISKLPMFRDYLY